MAHAEENFDAQDNDAKRAIALKIFAKTIILDQEYKTIKAFKNKD